MSDALDDELMLEPEPPKPAFWTVAVYLCDRAYGGPEEGGWWYDTGVRQDDHPPQVFTDLDEAYRAANALQATLDGGANDDGSNRDLSSVCCEGRYMAEIHEGYPPAGYPDQRPRYE